jgi:hypothetical protein
MKKTVKARYAGFLGLAIACLGWVLTAPAAQAQSSERYRRDVLTNTSYDRMRGWAREFERVATYANRQAQADQAGYRGFRRDSNFLKSIDHFARRSSEFRARMDSYRTRPWNVDEELDHLLRDARNVQKRIERARFVDASTRRDWSRVVDLLNRMLDEYRSGNGYRDDRYADDRYRRDDDRYRDDYAYSTDLGQLARELEARASRVSQLADRYGSRNGYSSELRRFSDQARDFRNDVEDSRRLSRSQLRSRVNRLLEGARDAHAEINRNRVSSDVAAEWDGIVSVLDRMRALVV